ncbi:MAG: cell wall-binding protein [Clostridiales bacterium]|nr:cell wall-binding protein [Clostridiales bacterium]
MRKQTKLVAVASAAALLAIGASMTSFAAAGWVEEDGVWYYYDSDGNRVEDEWKKSGDNWYWLDSEENGAMAVDKLIEDDDDTYYVDANGVMVKNTWVMVVNEDQDDDDDPAEYNYYYMQSNGKAYKQTGDSVSKKTINGKKYAFDEDGKMLYGWVDEDGEMHNAEDEWMDGWYYFGDWTDGSMKTGWQKITVHDDRTSEKDDDYDYWFNFKSNGKKRTKENLDDTWKSGGKYYHFDEDGVMVYQWFITTTDASTAETTKGWAYFNSPEDGARATKGWFKVVPPTDDNSYYEEDDTFATSDSEDEDERWYYADSDGELAVGEIKKIKGKYYGFYPEGSKAGRMMVGLCAIEMDPEDGSQVVGYAFGNSDYLDMDADDLDDFFDDVEDVYAGNSSYDVDYLDNVYMYFFGDSDDIDTDGAAKTGNVTINLDGDTFNFYFKKTGGEESRGRGERGIDDGDYIYDFGQKIKADSDEKYIVVYADGDIGEDGVKVLDYDSTDIRNCSINEADLKKYKGYNKDGDELVTFITGFTENMYLVNTSGKIQDSKKSGTKDGDDWYWWLEKSSGGKGNILAYSNSKDFDEIFDNTTQNAELLAELKAELGITSSDFDWDDLVVVAADDTDTSSDED